MQANKFEDYYELLGVHSKAGQDEIRQAYLNRLKQWHPDKNLHRTTEAEEITKILNQAYHILSDPRQRKTYDRMLRFTKGKDFSKYINDETFREKINKASPVLKRILKNVHELYALFNDAVKGRHKLHPITLGIIGGGLLYFIIPTDFIPDVIPSLGFLDDLAVLTTIINSLQSELNDYRNRKQNNT
jgi:curved DNA-binding protein CbpA